MSDRKYNAVIFDLDGTLLDTLEDLTDSVNYSLSEMGYRTRTIEEVRCFVGNGVEKLMKRAVPEGISGEDFDKTFCLFKEYYGKNSRVKTKPYKGVCELISTLKDRGYKIGIVSNKLESAVCDLRDDFFAGVDVALGDVEGRRRKPYPDSCNEALKLLGVDREHAIYVGDSDVDLLTAKNSGLRCISVTWGFRDRDFLIAHNAEVFADCPMEILDIIE